MASTSKNLPIITWTIIFLLGFLCGIGFAVYKMRPAAGSPAASTSPAASKNNQDLTAAITRLEAETVAHPENFKSWVQLGHLYYDSDQPQKAIAAYNKSLQLHSGDANLYTDLGTMYRAAGQPEQAVAAFDKARQLDARHQPARFNKGIVQLNDLHDLEGALASWQELLTLNPEAQTSDGHKLRELVDELAKKAKP